MKASENLYPIVLFDQQATNPSSPASGTYGLFIKDDGLPYRMGYDGVEHVIGSGGGSSITTYVCLREKKTQNTDAGTFSSGAWQTRDLNEEQSDAGGLASLSSGQITLAAGTYRANISAPAFRVDYHQARLWNITDNSLILMGTSEVSASGNGGEGTSRSVIQGRFTINAQKVLEVQHQCATSGATTGLGKANNFGDEIYTIVVLEKEP